MSNKECREPRSPENEEDLRKSRRTWTIFVFFTCLILFRLESWRTVLLKLVTPKGDLDIAKNYRPVYLI